VAKTTVFAVAEMEVVKIRTVCRRRLEESLINFRLRQRFLDQRLVTSSPTVRNAAVDRLLEIERIVRAHTMARYDSGGGYDSGRPI